MAASTWTLIVGVTSLKGKENRQNIKAITNMKEAILDAFQCYLLAGGTI